MIYSNYFEILYIIERTRDDWTALHLAAFNNFVELCEILLKEEKSLVDCVTSD